jgi:hypothetical protein
VAVRRAGIPNREQVITCMRVLSLESSLLKERSLDLTPSCYKNNLGQQNISNCED